MQASIGYKKKYRIAQNYVTIGKNYREANHYENSFFDSHCFGIAHFDGL
jgi:hypothetical protein